MSYLIYLALFAATVTFLWLLGKFSKGACAIAGLVGLLITMVGSSSGNPTVVLFGLGLLVFSGIVFLVYNGGKW